MKPMAKNSYTPEELEAAKEFVKKRLESEQSMSADVERLLYTYAGYLLSALFKGASDEDLELLIQDLVEQLLSDCELLAVDDRDDERDAILLYMNSERFADTLESHINERCHTFYNEVAAVYTAGKMLGQDEDALLSSIKENLEHPWQNEVLVEVRDKITKGEIEADISDFEEPHFGKGVPISSKTDLEFRTIQEVVDVWNEFQWRENYGKGAKGYFVLRGSSFPCEECDSHTGVFFPIEDKDNLPQYHRSCRCYVVYSFIERL